MSPNQRRGWVSMELMWAMAIAFVVASLTLTLLVSAAFPIFAAWVLHLGASTLFLRKGLREPSFVVTLYWACSNALLLGVAIWGLVKVPEGLLSL